ncbi:hypothetical protein BH18ACI4_BH18ACI4_02480 [soil metagenome]
MYAHVRGMGRPESLEDIAGDGQMTKPTLRNLGAFKLITQARFAYGVFHTSVKPPRSVFVLLCLIPYWDSFSIR